MKRILKIRGGEVLILVFPMNGGKNIFFILPGMVDRGGINIMVVSFMVLIDDLMARA